MDKYIRDLEKYSHVKEVNLFGGNNISHYYIVKFYELDIPLMYMFSEDLTQEQVIEKYEQHIERICKLEIKRLEEIRNNKWCCNGWMWKS